MAYKSYKPFLINCTVVEVGKSEIKLPTDLVSGDFLPGSQMEAVFQPCPRGRRDEGSLGGCVYKGTSIVDEGSAITASSPPEGPISKYHHIGV